MRSAGHLSMHEGLEFLRATASKPAPHSISPKPDGSGTAYAGEKLSSAKPIAAVLLSLEAQAQGIDVGEAAVVKRRRTRLGVQGQRIFCGAQRAEDRVNDQAGAANGFNQDEARNRRIISQVRNESIFHTHRKFPQKGGSRVITHENKTSVS